VVPRAARVDVGETANTHLRAGDEDRHAIAERLRDAAGDGRLSVEELEERLELVYAAKTLGELAPLTDDLPTDPRRGAGMPLQLSSTLAHLRREGYWEPPAAITVWARMADVRLDLTQARIPAATMHIDVHGWASSVEVIVPDGAAVEIDGLSTPLASSQVRGSRARADGVTVRISGRMTLGSVRARRLSVAEAFLRRTFGR
jgi:hypothetical protein